MKITAEELDHHAHICVEGSLTNENQREFEDVVTRYIEEHRFVIVDFSKLVFITSSGLGLLLSSSASAKKKGKAVIIFGLSDDMTKLFKLTELYYHLNVFETLEDCLDFMKKSEN
ncbi:MAG TPA: STAS domain-containing protein [Spirochaetota bacterium]|nr:STAS domain-containing protein [Spirochaetota bacterium]HPJ39503.1 STAS domain-containing protein [Spirochaetota bacterium]HPQ55035.1 STAS domain-containing protein [Spirochaetota bacterium]